MIVLTMTDDEVLSEFQKEIDDGKGIFWKVEYWNDRFLKRNGNEILKRLEKEGKISSSGFIKDFVSIEPITFSTKRGNNVVSYNFIRGELSNILDENIRYGNYFKVPVTYRYKPKNGKESVRRNGYHYLKLTRMIGNKYIKEQGGLVRITSHVLDRLYQRSELFREKVISENFSNIQAFSLLDDPVKGPICCTRQLREAILQTSDEEIRASCSDPKEFEFLLMIKKGVAYKRFLDGYFVYSVGIIGETIPTYITFLTEKQFSDKVELAEIERYALDMIDKVSKQKEFEEFE